MARWRHIRRIHLVVILCLTPPETRSIGSSTTYAEALATDAGARGWLEEADRHRRLVARLDVLLAQAQTV